ncbi:ESX secretion-associated protein EspG [Actinokineospora sp. PR83]|uniref:ESX secretion-associated protein EspG n=1 Tax=Actinokineospora sp. PR83 TaxID=2884908 RepID=UPI0027152360|nr:ESX secretion-associated protein EspG [Actinokineospora sp. PR83]
MVATLTEVEFDLTWEALGLGERPYPIDVPSFGTTTAEREDLRIGVIGSLTAKNLHDGRELDRELEDHLVLLARNDFSLDGLLSVGVPLRVLGVGQGSRSALAVQAGGEIRVGAAGPGGVVAEVAGMLPEVPAGPGNPVTLPKQVFHDAIDAYVAGGFANLEHALNRGGVSGRDLRTVTTLVESARSGGGQVAANAVDRMGRRTRTPVLNWFDTSAGRYLVLTSPQPDGSDWLTIGPVDPQRLAGRIRDLVDGVRA